MTQIFDNECPKCKMQDYHINDYNIEYQDDHMRSVRFCYCPHCHFEWDYVEVFCLVRTDIEYDPSTKI